MKNNKLLVFGLVFAVVAAVANASHLDERSYLCVDSDRNDTLKFSVSESSQRVWHGASTPQSTFTGDNVKWGWAQQVASYSNTTGERAKIRKSHSFSFDLSTGSLQYSLNNPSKGLQKTRAYICAAPALLQAQLL